MFQFRENVFRFQENKEFERVYVLLQRNMSFFLEKKDVIIF